VSSSPGGRSPSHRRPWWAGTPLDARLAAGLGVLSLSAVLALPAGPPYRPVDAVTLALAALGAAALLWRQSAPLAALSVAGSAVVVNAAVGNAIGFLDWPAWIALFTCFDGGGRRIRAAAAVVTTLAVGGYVLLDRSGPIGALPGIVIHFLLAMVIGDLSSRRARAAATEAQRAAESRQQALAAERLLLQERGRLARELHDSLGHTVNVMVLQAGVGRRVFADNPRYAHQALTSIETVGRAALDELNRLLRVLQPDERGTPDPFTPTATDLEHLVERVRGTGRPVHLRADVGVLPEATARAVYRIVQEALTNAVRHTSVGEIEVDVSRPGGDVLVEVVNACDRPPEPVPGHGLVNMRERARLEGGVLDAGPIDGGFRVRAVLPLGAAVVP
jgi:signal transduction histidine kinase